MSGKSGTKRPKIYIRPHTPSHTLRMETTYAEKTWDLLHKAIKRIHEHDATVLSFEELYRNAYNMVSHKHGDLLYNGLKDTVATHLRSVATAACQPEDDLQFLHEVDKAWRQHKMSMIMIRDLFLYMDRVYVQSHGVRPVYDLGLEIFCKEVAHHERIKDRLLTTILSEIAKERKGEVVDRQLLKHLLQMLVDVGIDSRDVYEKDFEEPYLQTSAEFYEAEAQAFITENSCPDYMKKTEHRLREEKARVEHYLDEDTEECILEVVTSKLVAKNMVALVEMEGSGIIPMLRDDKFEDLRRMYDLFSRVDGGLRLMQDKMFEFIVSTGKALVDQNAAKREPLKYIRGVLEMHAKFDKLVCSCFCPAGASDPVPDKNFKTTMNKAFDTFINQYPRSPEFLSLFIDHQLKKGLKGVTEAEVEETLRQAMTIFQYLEDKDVFEKYYKQHLAKRLLNAKSVSDDAEQNLIQKLKAECGFQFTSKMECMFKDVSLSADFTQKFQETSIGQEQDIKLEVTILTTGFWPTAAVRGAVVLPQEVARLCTTFQNYYLNQHSGRKLTWQFNMGTAELRSKFDTENHDLIVNTMQMCILMLFNTHETLGFKEIQTKTGIAVQDLRKNLLTLALGKNRILKKPRKGKSVEEDDEFSVNTSFTSKLFRVKILPMAAKGETDEEKDKTRETIEKDREHQIEAAIVRIMKARKTLEHTKLIEDVTKQLEFRFKVNPTVVKKRIESLIEREYLERGTKDRRMYNYLA